MKKIRNPHYHFPENGTHDDLNINLDIFKPINKFFNFNNIIINDNTMIK